MPFPSSLNLFGNMADLGNHSADTFPLPLPVHTSSVSSVLLPYLHLLSAAIR